MINDAGDEDGTSNFELVVRTTFENQEEEEEAKITLWKKNQINYLGSFVGT